MPNRSVAFFFLLSLLLLAPLTSIATAKEKKAPMNPDKGDIVLAGVVLVPGDGSNTGVEGLQALQGALVVLEGTKHVTTTDARGLFIFTEAPEGEVTVVITCEGYQPIRRRAKVVKGADTPETLRIEMLPTGATVINGALTGPGTLYATFVPRQVETAGEKPDLTNFLSVLALGIDPVGEPREILTQDPNAPGWNPVTDLSHFLMILPPQAPSRTTYHKLGAVPIWPCFNKTGNVLYVSTTARRIEVLDVPRGNDLLAFVPIPKDHAVTDMAVSADGRRLWVCLMGRVPTLLAVDTTTHTAAATFLLDAEMMIPTSICPSPSGERLYITLASGLDRNKPGEIVAVDPQNGDIVARASVGAVPTDVKISSDGEVIYVANCGTGSVTVHEAHSLKQKSVLATGVAPVKLALTSDDQKLLVTNRGSDTVMVWDLPASLPTVIRVGDGPVDIVLTRDGKGAYVSNGGDGTISLIDVIDRRTVYHSSPNPRANPLGLAIRP